MKNQNLSILNYLKFDNVLNCAKELEELAKANSNKKRKKLVKLAEDCVINSISEIALNCLNGNVPLSEIDFNKLSKYQNLLRKLTKISSVKKRRNIISQTGGFLNLLIPPALSLIASVVGGYLSKRLSK